MLTLLAVVMFNLSPTLCDEIERELIEFNQDGGGLPQQDVNRIIKECRAKWSEPSPEVVD